MYVNEFDNNSQICLQMCRNPTVSYFSECYNTYDFDRFTAFPALRIAVIQVLLKGDGDMIREAKISDAARIAAIEVASCRFAYKDIVPEKYLFDDLTAESRIPSVERWISEKRFELYVYEDPDTGAVNGMMGIGRCEDEDKENAFELHFIYVDPDHLRAGIGSEMLLFFEQKGKERGFEEFVIWVLEENQLGKSFYEKHNYSSDGKEKIFRRWNKREIRYVKGS